MKRFTLILTILLIGMCASAQRRITPVNNAATATQATNENKAKGDSLDRSRLMEMTDSHGNKILVDTISGREFVDSTMMIQTSRVPKMIYPLLYNVAVSVDLFQPLMRAFGQKYGLVEFGAELNLHNRYIPVVEVGLGQAKNTPEDNNFTYRSPMSVYFRIGANYNFLFNSNPDYMVYCGLRYGLSPFKYSVTDITQPPGYWDEPLRYDIPDQKVTAGYLQLLFGIRVRIKSSILLGWSVNYHSLLHESATPHGEPWYIPGFGTRNSKLSATFTVTYTLPLSKPTPAEPATPNQ